MKIYISKETQEAIAKSFAYRYQNMGEDRGDEFTAAANDLADAKRDENGYFNIKRATFDMLMDELDWCYGELARREKEDRER